VYATANNASQIENDCYGLEGVEVEIEAGDGQVWTTTTNRAGNFFFDGEPSWLVKPYVATLRYTTPAGRLIAPQMVATLATYGGCARCHDGRATATTDIASGYPELVQPANALFVE
jgi:cytochrome c553